MNERSQFELEDIRASFPSGHSSYVAFAMLFLAVLIFSPHLFRDIAFLLRPGVRIYLGLVRKEQLDIRTRKEARENYANFNLKIGETEIFSRSLANVVFLVCINISVKGLVRVYFVGRKNINVEPFGRALKFESNFHIFGNI